MKSTVAFPLLTSEAYEVLTYKQRHPSESVRILSPEIEVQNFLEENSLPRFDFFANSYYRDPHLYRKSFWTAEKKAVMLTEAVLNFFQDQFPQIRDYLLPLQNWLEMAYLETLETSRFQDAVKEEWRPTKYLITKMYQNQNTNLYNPFASQWELLQKFFIPFNQQENTRSELKPKKNSVVAKISHLFRTEHLQQELLPLAAERLAERLNLISPPDSTCEVLIFSAGRNLYTYESLLKKLFTSSLKTHIITGAQTLTDELQLRHKQIPYIPATRFIDKEMQTQAKTEIQNTADLLKQKLFQLKTTQIFSSFQTETARAFFEKTQVILQENLPKSILQTLLARRIIRSLSPKLMLTTHDPGPTAMPFVLAAKRQHIPTLLLMHGWQETILGVNHQSDYIAVWGPYIARWYEKKLNKKKSQIFPLGYPLFDEVFNKVKSQLSTSTFLFSTSPIRIGLLLTMYLPSTALLSKFLYEVFTCSRQASTSCFISIRLHPSQPTAEIKKLADCMGMDGIEINAAVSLEHFILGNDVILSWDTTAMFWVMAYGKPLFYCAPNWEVGITPVKKLGGAWLAKNAREFFRQVEKLRNSPEKLKWLHMGQKKFLEQVIGITDGTSSEKHFHLIESLLLPPR